MQEKLTAAELLEKKASLPWWILMRDYNMVSSFFKQIKRLIDTMFGPDGAGIVDYVTHFKNFKDSFV